MKTLILGVALFFMLATLAVSAFSVQLFEARATVSANGNDLIDSSVASTQQNTASSSDWPMFHHSPSHTGNSYSTAPDTNVTMWNYTTENPVKSSPAVADGMVFVGSYDH